MADFILDTSGAVCDMHPLGFLADKWTWPDLSLFQQGYVEAAFASACDPVAVLVAEDDFSRSWDPAIDASLPRDVGFSDLHPETLAAMMKDCKLSQAMAGGPGNHEAGEYFWHERQQGLELRFPPLTLYPDDEGKVRQREAAA